MIHIQTKPFQVVLWTSESRSGSDPALRLEFESRVDAQTAYDAEQLAGSYRAGILMEWHKVSGEWDLLDQFPK